jgi:hypothetical protein
MLETDRAGSCSSERLAYLSSSNALQAYGLKNALPGTHRHMLWLVSLGAPENVGFAIDCMYAGPDWRAFSPCSKA